MPGVIQPNSRIIVNMIHRLRRNKPYKTRAETRLASKKIVALASPMVGQGNAITRSKTSIQTNRITDALKRRNGVIPKRECIK
jgi:hypothetical protein